MTEYRGKQVIVTGGLGFIGSNLALRLAHLGARVTVIDSEVVGCGANLYNLHGCEPPITVILRDLLQAGEYRELLRRCDLVFNLAGEISHPHSMSDPARDLRINQAAHLEFLLRCAEESPGVRMVFASTRQVYGAPRYLPVDEAHPLTPVDFNGVHKRGTEDYHLLLGNRGVIDPIVLRLSNVYGPRMALDNPCQGVLSVFFRRALLGQTLELYGHGEQTRDPLYIDDAVQAFLLAGLQRKPAHRIYNVGGPRPETLRHIAAAIVDAAGHADLVEVPFPEHRKQIDIGNYYADCRRIQDELGWFARIGIAQGALDTAAFYRSQLCHYVDTSVAEPVCELLRSKDVPA